MKVVKNEKRKVLRTCSTLSAEHLRDDPLYHFHQMVGIFSETRDAWLVLIIIVKLTKVS